MGFGLLPKEILRAIFSQLQLSYYLFAFSDPTRKWSVYRRYSNSCQFYEEIEKKYPQGIYYMNKFV